MGWLGLPTEDSAYQWTLASPCHAITTEFFYFSIAWMHREVSGHAGSQPWAGAPGGGRSIPEKKKLGIGLPVPQILFLFRGRPPPQLSAITPSACTSIRPQLSALPPRRLCHPPAPAAWPAIAVGHLPVYTMSLKLMSLCRI